MDITEKALLVDHCLRYIEAQALPMPLPDSVAEYREWRDKALNSKLPDQDDEEAWFELYELVDDQPLTAWEIIRDVAARCRTEPQCAAFAVGPFAKFVRTHGEAFAKQIQEELARCDGFRMTYRWL